MRRRAAATASAASCVGPSSVGQAAHRHPREAGPDGRVEGRPRLREQGRRLIEDRLQDPGLVRCGWTADDLGDFRRRLGQPERCGVDVEEARERGRAHLIGLVASDGSPKPLLPQLVGQAEQGIEAVHPRLAGSPGIALGVEDAGRLLAHRSRLFEV